MKSGKPTMLDVTGRSIEDVGADIIALVKDALASPARSSEHGTLW